MVETTAKAGTASGKSPRTSTAKKTTSKTTTPKATAQEAVPSGNSKLQDARDRYIAELEAENALLQSRLKEKAGEEYLEEEEFDISPNSYVKVMSLLPYRLNLCTKERGQGNVYKFDSLFQVKRIIYKDLAEILEANRHFLEDGSFIILNKKVVRMNGLDEIQERNLSKEQIEKIFEGSEEGLSLYANANETQQKMIIDTIIQKMVENPESVDLNIVDKISRISKINISQRAEDSRLLLKPETAVGE